MHYRLADYVLWFAVPLVQTAVLIAMYRRGLNRRYPFFLTYTVLQVAASLILGVLFAHSYTLYYYAYYFNLCLSVLISFLVLWEIVKKMLGRSRWAGITFFVVLCAATLAIALFGLFLLQKSNFTAWMMLFDRTLRLHQVVVMLALIWFSRALGVSSKSITFGVTLGFGLFAIANVFVAAAASHHGFLTSATLSRMNGTAYLVAAVIWFLYVAFGLEDESGRDRGSVQPLCEDDDQSRPEPARWFFREGLIRRGAVAGS